MHEAPIMRETDCVLRVGEAIQIGETIYTVMDIDDGEVCFRADRVAEQESPFAECRFPADQVPAK